MERPNTPLLEAIRLARLSNPTAQATSINPEFNPHKELNRVVEEMKARASQPTAQARPSATARPATMKAPVARAAAPSPAPGLVTAAAFAKPQMTIVRSEFNQLSEKDKSRFFAEGGKLIADPKPAKPTHKGGQLTREGLRQLTPSQANAYFANGNKLAAE